MFEMQSWQWAIVLAALLGGLFPMVGAILRLFTTRSGEAPAIERRATHWESALAGGTAPEETTSFDAFSYRVSARFAGKVRVVVGRESLVVSGPRVPERLYRVWIWVQGLMLAVVPAAFVWAVVSLDWRPAVLGLAIAVTSAAISTIGAGVWPGFGDLEFLTEGAYKAVEIPLSSLSDIALGEAWSRGGMDVVLLPYKKGVDAMAKDGAVSYFAPDERGLRVRFALHCPNREDTLRLESLLRAGAGVG